MDTKNKLIKLNGLVINEQNYKEYDKLLTLFTKELGKIKLYAFNVRKQNSKNISKCRLFSFSTFEVRNIKDSYQLESAILIKNFDDIAKDYDSMCLASYIIELIDYFSFENLENESIYKLLYYTFNAINAKKVEMALIRRIFELKMLKYEGIYKESSNVPEKIRYTWNYILNTEPEKLYSFTITDELMKIFDVEMDIEMKEKVGKKFKTLSYINDAK